MSLNLPSEVLDRLRKAQKAIVFTDHDGMFPRTVFDHKQLEQWANYSKADLYGLDGYHRNPDLLWSWFQYCRTDMENLVPSAAYYALVELEQYYPEFKLITLNTNGMHWRSGNRDLIEVRGSIHRARCMEIGHAIGDWDDTSKTAPRCAQCGRALRPDICLHPETTSKELIKNIIDLVTTTEIVILLGVMVFGGGLGSVTNIAKRAGAYIISLSVAPPLFSPDLHLQINANLAEGIPELVALITQNNQ